MSEGADERNGKLVRADHEHEPDLFWALRGGGNFGAVTALEFELYSVPELYACMLAWPWERTADVLHAWRDRVPGLPGEMGDVGAGRRTRSCISSDARS